jgi:hypothetical protein
VPDTSSIRTFIQAIKTGQTKTTKVLNALFGNNTASYNGSTLFDGDHLGKANVLDNLRDPAVSWACDELRKPGQSDSSLAISEADIDHINSWPAAEKEQVRQALVAAVGPPGGPSRGIHFSWGLYDGASSRTQVNTPPAPGAITVIFQSPRANVEKSTITYGDIQVRI